MNQRKNLTGMTTVVALHVVLLAAFLHGSKLTVFKPAPQTIDLVPNLEPPAPKPRDLQVQEPRMKEPDVFVPVPVVAIPTESPPTIARRTETPPDASLPPARSVDGDVTPARPAPVVTPAVVDAQACSKPDYPKNALRNGDTGTVMLAFLIGTDGKVADSRIEKSSGFRDLDRAAQAGLSLCHFKPGTVDGVAQQSWTRMQYIWSLD